MATPSTNSTVISRTNSGFPDYLDFDTLRSSSIKYLSGLTGKVWTDYNLHDPGITILEALIYALMDLGYRTNLPVADIFAPNPDDVAGEDNFFTPGKILACNPVTITDFRKLLVDIDGVKNAWLAPVTDAGLVSGLYHIRLQLDDPLLRAEADVIRDVQQQLLTHRNLCEDFIDISILCPLKIGVFADIGLAQGADAAAVGKDILLALGSFFSPAPVFYTLQQLLEKNKKIEDIFAGRPLALPDEGTHGFLDIDEFEAITLKKTIHLSDVYNCILKIDGVSTVQALRLKTGGGNFIDNWQFTLPDDYTPVFSADLSTIQFTVNGVAVPVDLQSISAAASALPGNSGKLPKRPENIDLQAPTGVYHNDLASYYSIQNEFPRVYGIGEGGLGKSASLQRQAQALQLKGYLLFFDQLLANYLSQLTSIRKIYSLRSPAAGNASTYFTNVLSDGKGDPGYVPDMSQLLFHINSGSDRTTLGYPVWKKDWDDLLKQENPGDQALRKLQQDFQCQTQEEYKVVAGVLQTLFASSDQYAVAPAVSTKDGFYCCWISFPGSDIVITGPLYADKTAATRAIGLLPAAGTDHGNYSKFSTGDGSCSFTIGLQMPSYAQYLAQVTEDRASYEKRREGFLDHLLSRFAEQFTDFALLSYGFIKNDRLPAAVVKNKETFLTNYPILSSTRGKGLEYRMPAGPDNSSGLEKRFRAYAGITDGACKSLCNFEVTAYEDGYAVRLDLAGFQLFDTPGVHEGPASAQAAAQSVFESLSDPGKYSIDALPPGDRYQVKVRFSGNATASYIGPYSSGKQEAEELAAGLQRMFKAGWDENNIFPSRFEYRLSLADSTGREIRVSTVAFGTEAAAIAAAIENLKEPSNPDKWQLTDPDNNPSGKFCTNNKRRPQRFIDTDHFKIGTNDRIVGKPEKFSYELLDNRNTFKCTSLNDFDTEKKARADAYRLLLLMVDEKNYEILPIEKKIYITNNNQRIAECLSEVGNGNINDFAARVRAIVNSHYYVLSVRASACRWKVRFGLGYEKDRDLLFESDAEFDELDKARKAAGDFFGALGNVSLQLINSKYSLAAADPSVGVLTCIHVGPVIEAMDDPDKLSSAQRLLELKKEIQRRQMAGAPLPFEQGIGIDELSRTGAYVFRLVDRDNFWAVHTIGEGGPGAGEGGPGAGEGADELSALYNNFPAAYNVLEICLGGDVAAWDQQTSLYHYLIRCRKANGPFAADTVLFRSVAGYATEEEAEAAFNANYLEVLGRATDANNYGPGKYIGLGEPGSVVLVPRETVQQAGNDATATLVATARSYPVRLSDAGDADCAGGGDKTYTFALYNRGTASDDWVSVRSYTTAAEARQAFYFFMLLLEYKGNYLLHTGYDNTTAIYIREVLAESTHRYRTEEDAWAGVGKFICIAQTAEAFRGIRRDDNTYSFTVACASAAGIHPYTYGSAEKRDAVLEQLFADFSAAGPPDWQPVQSDNGKFCTEIRLPAYINSCYPTWRSACCYDTKKDAADQLNIMAAALASHGNYRPYFDCSCYSYGIALLTDNDVIAGSPQRYTSREMVCNAIERSRRLINCEGLYLVEHILLRARAGGIPAPPVPDTYSFIATVALPSWPERFRKKDNRHLLEMILYREAPSHVLLNILWLSPQDTLELETSYRRWRWALLQNDIAAIDAASGHLMDLIVKLQDDKSAPCTDCLPCTTKNE